MSRNPFAPNASKSSKRADRTPRPSRWIVRQPDGTWHRNPAHAAGHIVACRVIDKAHHVGPALAVDWRLRGDTLWLFPGQAWTLASLVSVAVQQGIDVWSEAITRPDYSLFYAEGPAGKIDSVHHLHPELARAQAKACAVLYGQEPPA